MTFKTGDRVVCKNTDGLSGAPKIKGAVGTVIDASVNAPPLAVRFDEHNENLHSCLGRCENGHGYWCYEENLELLEASYHIEAIEDLLTDPDTDYEAVTKSRVYFEFVDVGKALNKLKNIEHSKDYSIKKPTEDFSKKDYALKVSKYGRIHVVEILSTINPDKVQVKEVDTGYTSVEPYDRIFKDLDKAVTLAKSTRGEASEIKFFITLNCLIMLSWSINLILNFGGNIGNAPNDQRFHKSV